MEIINSNEVHIFDELPWDKSNYSLFDTLGKLLSDKANIKRIIFYNVMRMIQVDSGLSYYFNLHREQLEKLKEFSFLESALEEFNETQI